MTKLTPEQDDLKVGDRVTYFKGAKGPLIGMTGTIQKVYPSDDRRYREVQVVFDNGQDSPCWVGNLEKCIP